jgi:ribosome maturation factor RimP
LPREEALERVRTAAIRVARDYGLEVFDVQFRRESIGWVLRVVLDRRPPTEAAPGSEGRVEEAISVADCQRVSEDLGAILDVEDPLDHQYTLEVSSPGLDRPLRHPGDYRRFQGRLARLVMADAIDGQKSLVGRLVGCEGDAVLVETERGRHRIPFTAITRGRLEVEF